MLRLGGLVVLAGFIALALPRRRPLVLTLLAGLLGLAGFVALVWLSPMPIVAGAAAGLFGVLIALLLGRSLPRLFSFLLLFASAPVAGLLPPRFMIGGTVATALVAAAIAWKREDLAMRLACAFVGARVLALVFHGAVPPWQRLALAAALFAAASVFPAQRAQLAPPLRPTAWLGLGLGLLLSGALTGAWLTAPVLPASARLARVAAEAPQGGLVWALPSESISWDEPKSDPAMFPPIDNLDALWLGAHPQWVWKLPGTTLFGRASLHGVISGLRELKDPAELQNLRAAARATVEALRENLKAFKPGAREADLATALLDSMKRRGCWPESFWPIVASGPRAFSPHGTGNDGTLKAGELVMNDLGCLNDHYASDFTRTFPVSGKFTERQRLLYQAVYDSQQAALALCKPGAKLADLWAAARKVFTDRGLDAHNSFGLGHTVGLFVHDVAKRRELAPGMVFTIEPGLYAPDELGIRIEDTYLVTASGCEDLTDGFPADPASIEAALR